MDADDNRTLSFEELPVETQDALAELWLPGVSAEEQLEVLREVTASHPNFLPAQLNLAVALADQGEIAAAEAHYRRLRDEYPEEAGATAGLSTVLAQQDRLEEAEPLAREALARGYTWPPCHEVIAQALAARGERNAAAAEYLLAYELAPHGWDNLEHYCALTDRPYTPPTEEVPASIDRNQLADLLEFIDTTAHTPDAEGEMPGCEHTLRFSRQWAEAQGVDVIALYQFLNGHGGFCDCEVCFNVANLLDEHDPG